MYLMEVKKVNRILLDNSNKETINIKEDTDLLIKGVTRKKIIFNIYNSNLNILVISSNSQKKTYELNIYGGCVSFNNISYDSAGSDICVNLNKEKSGITIHNSLVAKSKEICDIRINHNFPLTNSDIYNNGITLNDASIKFNVTSYAPKGSIKSKINQDSKIITLNKENNNCINPILLIDEYDTEARHAAFIGNFKESELFYLMSRGLNRNEASKLLIDGLLIGTLDIDFEEKEMIKAKLNDEWR